MGSVVVSMTLQIYIEKNKIVHVFNLAFTGAYTVASFHKITACGIFCIIWIVPTLCLLIKTSMEKMNGIFLPEQQKEKGKRKNSCSEKLENAHFLPLMMS